MNVETPLPIPLNGNVKYYNNIPYDKFNRTRIDLFVPVSNNPVPVVVHYHGGGFVVGSTDPTQYKPSLVNDIQSLLDKNIAFAYVNYRLMSIDGERETLNKSITCGRKSLDLLVRDADYYNLDTSKICLQGSSAGNGLIMDNIYNGSNDVKCVVLLSPLASYDSLSDILSAEGFDVIEDINTYPSSKKTYLRGIGYKNVSDFNRDDVIEYRASVNYMDLNISINIGEAYVETLNEPTPLENNPTLVAHHYRSCILIHDKFVLNEITSFLNIPTAPKPLTVNNPESKIDFIIRNLTQ